jgi:hypothetical protein
VRVRLTPAEEEKGEQLFQLILAEAGALNFVDLMELRAAWQGRRQWSDLTDRVRKAFARVAAELAES